MSQSTSAVIYEQDSVEFKKRIAFFFAEKKFEYF